LVDLTGRVVGIIVYTISIALLYTSFITAFAALRNLELREVKQSLVVLAAATLIHLTAILLTIYPLIVLSQIFSDKIAAILFDVPINLAISLIARFAYKKCDYREVIAFWVFIGLSLDVVALRLHGEVLQIYPK